MKNKIKRYLILGSNSFSGASYINFILNKDIKVIGISRQKESGPTMLSYRNNI